MDQNLITFLISSITGVFTYFVGHNRAKKEVDSIALTNLEKSIEIYNTIIQDLKSQITELLVKVDSLEKKVDDLKKENYELKRMLSEHDKKSPKRLKDADPKS